MRTRGGDYREIFLHWVVGETSRHSSNLISTSCIAIAKAALVAEWTTHVEIASGENSITHLSCIHSFFLFRLPFLLIRKLILSLHVLEIYLWLNIFCRRLHDFC